MSDGAFVFVTCQVGAEAHLKHELARLQPEWKPAFMRPGFLTFKAPGVRADVPLSAIFARAYGVSVGKASSAKEIVKLVPTARRLHVWSRAQWLPGDEPPAFVDSAPTVEKELRALRQFWPEREAATGDTVLDVVVVEPGEYWVGTHVQSSLHAPWPGGQPLITMPAAAPSRAYVKMVEALMWSGAPLAAGDTALELGSAPGGASYALLERGVSVVGVDTADMAAAVLDFPGPARFRHVRKRVAQLRESDVPDGPLWLALDVNLHPNDVFPALERVIAFAGERVRGGWLTFKLTDAKVAAQLPQLLDRVRALGFTTVRARQLTYGRREVLVYAAR